MKWVKKGLIFVPNREFEWMQTHASVPIAEKIKENIFRIYFSSRDKSNHSHTCYLELDIQIQKKLLRHI